MTQHKNSLKNFLLGAAACAVLITANPASAQDQLNQFGQPLSLTEAVATGVITHPEFGTVAANRRATDEELQQGRGLFRPSVDVNADTGFEHSDDPGTRAGTGDDEENLLRYEAGITLTQLLFDGWESQFEVERQRARVQSAAHRVRETAELVGLDVVEAYLEVLRQRMLLVISRQNIAAHEEIEGLIQDGVQAGRSTQADMEQIKARVASARAGEANTLQDLRNAEAQYRREVGEPAKKLVLPEIPYPALMETVEQEVDQTLAQSPTLDIFTSDIEVAYAEARGTDGVFYPEFNVQLNARQGHDLGGVEGRDRSASALVTMNWNLYRGGIDTARKREFIHRHQQSKEERADAARNLEADVRQTWASMVASAERARQFSNQADANIEVVKAYKDQFNLDRRTLLDVLDAQNELFVSRSNTVNSEFLEMFAVYRLLALKGELLPVLGVPYSAESGISDAEMWNIDQAMQAR